MTPTIGSVFRYRNLAPLHELLCNVCIPGIFSDGNLKISCGNIHISASQIGTRILIENYVNKLVISEEVNKWILLLFSFEYWFWTFGVLTYKNPWVSEPSRFFLLCKTVVLPFDMPQIYPGLLPSHSVHQQQSHIFFLPVSSLSN